MVLKAVLLQFPFFVINLRNSEFAHFRVKKVFVEMRMHESAFGQIVLFRFSSQESCVTFAQERHQKEFLSLASAIIGVVKYELHASESITSLVVYFFSKNFRILKFQGKRKKNRKYHQSRKMKNKQKIAKSEEMSQQNK